MISIQSETRKMAVMLMSSPEQRGDWTGSGLSSIYELHFERCPGDGKPELGEHKRCDTHSWLQRGTGPEAAAAAAAAPPQPS